MANGASTLSLVREWTTTRVRIEGKALELGGRFDRSGFGRGGHTKRAINECNDLKLPK